MPTDAERFDAIFEAVFGADALRRVQSGQSGEFTAANTAIGRLMALGIPDSEIIATLREQPSGS